MLRTVFVTGLLALLLACGGGGGSGGAGAPEPPPAQPPSQPPDPNTPPDPNAPPMPSQAFACGSGGATLTGDAAPGSYVLFESGPVRPLALSADGRRLLVTNTPANCLEIYTVSDAGFELQGSVMVGLEPVAVAFADADEAWVVNHLSDSVSVVALDGTPRVTRTLLVGDEPRDIVFAGPEGQRAFITAAYRGQNHPGFVPDDLTTPGLGRADVWVYDRRALDNSLNGNPLAIVNLFADTPRALAVSPGGETVYAAAFMSGNGTTTLAQDVVAGQKPQPRQSVEGARQPATGLVVKQSGRAWVDESGRDWSAELRFDLPDLDVFAIDAMAATPRLRNQQSGVGTVLFNMATNPVNGELYVSNLESLNHIRFEGPGESASTVRGRIAESRISVIDIRGVTVNHLNPHIDFDVEEGHDYPASDVRRSLSQPTSLAVSPDGARLYVAAFGSGKVAAIHTGQLRDGDYRPDPALQVELPGGGPAGLALSSDGARLVVYTRFDNAVSLWDTTTGTLLAQRPLFSPEPAAIVEGRRFLYDAQETSANGTSACASCHVFGDMDQLAWDLGNPDALLQPNPNEYVTRSIKTTINFHPMKGPMTTQTLRGIADSGPQHWRGDRTGQNREMVRGELESVEAAAFKEFNPAFVGLVGRSKELSKADMQRFTDFAMALTPPPNPVRRLDNSLTPAQARGRDIYFEVDDITGTGSCNHCHTLDPAQKHFGTSGLMSFEGQGIAENFKIPSFRNAYAKVGMFGTSGDFGDGRFYGAQVKGFGYLHDGSIASLADFFATSTFNFPAPQRETQADVVRFVMAADSNMAPVVGQQVTLSPRSGTAAQSRLDLLESRAAVSAPLPECDLLVRGLIDGVRISALYRGKIYRDTAGNDWSGDNLRQAANRRGNALTFTCAPPGTGRRIALDRR
jgi:DNA-binding beta-propeller fold protein YncE